MKTHHDHRTLNTRESVINTSIIGDKNINQIGGIQDTFINSIQLNETEKKHLKERILLFFNNKIGLFDVTTFVVGALNKFTKIDGDNYEKFMSKTFEKEYDIIIRERIKRNNLIVELCDNRELLTEISKVLNYIESFNFYSIVVKMKMNVMLLQEEEEDARPTETLEDEKWSFLYNIWDVISKKIDRNFREEKEITCYRIFIDWSKTKPLKIDSTTKVNRKRF